MLHLGLLDRNASVQRRGHPADSVVKKIFTRDGICYSAYKLSPVEPLNSDRQTIEIKIIIKINIKVLLKLDIVLYTPGLGSFTVKSEA